MVSAASDGDRRQQPEGVAVEQRAEVELDPDEGEEEGREEGVEGPHFFLDRALVLGLGDDHPGEEGADQRRQADAGGEGGEAEAEDHRRQQRRFGEARRLQQLRPALQQPRAAERDEGDEGDRHRQGEDDLAGVDAAVGRHPDRDREQDQGEDVVDHGGAEHGAGRPGCGRSRGRGRSPR